MTNDLIRRLREEQPVTQDMESTSQCDLQDEAADRIEELEAKLAKAVAIANRRGVYVPTTAIECRGDKYRESWCASCYGDDHAEAYVRKVTDQDATDRATLAELKGPTQ